MCHQVYTFFTSQQSELRRFALDLLPVLVHAYLNAVSRGDKKVIERSIFGVLLKCLFKMTFEYLQKCSGLEACLLGFYNLVSAWFHDDRGCFDTFFRVATLQLDSLHRCSCRLAALDRVTQQRMRTSPRSFRLLA